MTFNSGSDAEITEPAYPEPIPDVAPSNTEANEDIDDADHTVARGVSGQDNNDKDVGDESTNDNVDVDENMRHQRDGVAQSSRRSTRVSEMATPPYYGMIYPEENRAELSRSRSPSTKRRPGRPPKRPKLAARTNTPTSNSTSADVGRAATPVPAHSSNSIPEDLTPPNLQSTPQTTPAEHYQPRPASEAGTSGTPREAHRERALAKKQLEWAKVKNRAAELEARNKADEMQQKIEFEARFGGVLGD